MKKSGMLLLAALLFLAAAGALNRPLLERRLALRPPSQTDLRQASPMVAFVSVAIGGFRGILADCLWLRISSLQDEGNYFEIAQLSDWITRLEPTFTEVWSFHAWNMAYNIGFMFDDPADRWRWVEKALNMLRDDGLRSNPDDPRLCWEVGWMFFNKIGGFADEAAGYYQVSLFRSVDAVVPGGRLSDPRPDTLLLERFRMDGETMAKIDRSLGPLDWRLPESQAIYWAWMAREKSGPRPDRLSERLLYQSMMGACLWGRIEYHPESLVKVRLPRIDLFQPALRLMESEMRLFPDDEGIRTAHDFLVRMAIFQLYAHGADESAGALLRGYRLEHPQVAEDTAVFAMEEAGEGRLITAGYLDLVEGLFFEAEVQRGAGKRVLANRMDALARAGYNGLARVAGGKGMPLTVSVEELCERGYAQARAMRADGGGTPP